MNKKQIYFKSDFTVILASESQWGGCPFRLSFYTASPSRAFVASFDGENWENCRLLDDGRLEVAINQKDGTMQTLMGIGTLMCAPEFYLDNDAFRDHVCNEFVKPFAPVFVDTDGTEYNVILDLNGSSTLVTIGTLPAFYMRGPMGDVDWEKVTPEQLEILQRPAREAADVANAAAAEATSAAENATSAADSANKQATLAATMISRAAKASAAAENAATDATKAADRAHEEADNALAASIDAKSATKATKSAIDEANSVVTDSRNAMATIGAQFLNIKQNASEATQAANTAAEGATAAMENIEAPKDGKAYNRKDGAWTVAEGGMTPAERAKLTELDLKVGELEGDVEEASTAAANAEASATAAEATAAAAEGLYSDILGAMQSLPDGSAVSAQVAVNTAGVNRCSNAIYGGTLVGERVYLTYTSASYTSTYDVETIPAGTTIRVWIDKISGGSQGVKCYVNFYANTTAASNQLITDGEINQGEDSSYIDVYLKDDTNKLIVNAHKEGANPWGTNMSYATVESTPRSIVNFDDLQKVEEDISALNDEVKANEEDIKKSRDYINHIVGDESGEQNIILHEFAAANRYTLGNQGKALKWFIDERTKVTKTGVSLKKIEIEYIRHASTSYVTVRFGIFEKEGNKFKLVHLIFGNDETNLGHNGNINIPTETGTGFSTASFDYKAYTTIEYKLKYGQYIGVAGMATLCCYNDGNTFELTDNGDGTYTPTVSNIVPAIKITTTDVKVDDNYMLSTDDMLKRYNLVSPNVIRRAKRYACTSNTKIFLLGDSIASDTMGISPNNYDGFRTALADLCNIPKENISRAGMPGLGAAWFSCDKTWEGTSSKNLIHFDADIIISIVGANDSGEPSTVGTFSGLVDGEPIVPDLPFSVSTEGNYGREGATHFIQQVSWICQRYINTYYDIRTRAGVTTSDSVEQANAKMASVKLPRLIICTNLPQKRSGSAANYSKSENWKRKRDAIVEVCNKYGIECVDLLGAAPWDVDKEPAFATAEWKNRGIYTMDGLHPNDAGFRVISEIICAESGIVKAD